MSRANLFDEFQKFKPKALAWLRRKGVPDDEAEDLTQEVWLRVEQHLERGGTIDRHPQSYYWRILFHVFGEWVEKRRRFGCPMDAPPDHGNNGDAATADARRDAKQLIAAYRDVRRTEADLIWTLVIEKAWDFDAAARVIAEREGLDPDAWEIVRRQVKGETVEERRQVVDRIKRRLSAYLARFFP